MNGGGRTPWFHLCAVAITAIGGYAVLGPIGACVGVLAAASFTRFGTATIATEFAAAASVALVLAAVATVLEQRIGPGSIQSGFSVGRPVAAGAAAVAGALTIATVALGWVATRASSPTGPVTVHAVTPFPAAWARRFARTGWKIAIPAVLAGVGRWVLGPDTAPAWALEMAARMRGGVDLAVAVAPGDLVAPGLPFVLVVVPQVRVPDVLLSVTVVLVAARLAQRWAGSRASTWAAWAAAVLPSVWLPTRASLLAAVLVGACALLATDQPLDGRGALLVGAAAAAALVMAPTSVVLLVLLVLTIDPARLSADPRLLVALLGPIVLAGVVILRFLGATGVGAGALVGMGGGGGVDRPAAWAIGLDLAVGAVPLILLRRVPRWLPVALVGGVHVAVAVATGGRGALWCEAAVLVAVAAGASVGRARRRDGWRGPRLAAVVRRSGGSPRHDRPTGEPVVSS